MNYIPATNGPLVCCTLFDATRDSDYDALVDIGKLPEHFDEAQRGETAAKVKRLRRRFLLS